MHEVVQPRTLQAMQLQEQPKGPPAGLKDRVQIAMDVDEPGLREHPEQPDPAGVGQAAGGDGEVVLAKESCPVSQGDAGQ